MSNRKKVDLIKQAQKKTCEKCEKESGVKDVDVCFNCPWHILFNLLLDLKNGD